MNGIVQAPNPLEAKAEVRELTKKRDRLLTEIEDLNKLKKSQGESIAGQIGQKKAELERLSTLILKRSKALRALNEVIETKIALVDEYAEKTTNAAIKGAISKIAYARTAESEALARVVQISKLQKSLTELEAELRDREQAVTSRELAAGKKETELSKKQSDLDTKEDQVTEARKVIDEAKTEQVDAKKEADDLIEAAQTKAAEIISKAQKQQKDVDTQAETLEVQRKALDQREKSLDEQAEAIRRDRLYLEDQQRTFKRATRSKG